MLRAAADQRHRLLHEIEQRQPVGLHRAGEFLEVGVEHAGRIDHGGGMDDVLQARAELADLRHQLGASGDGADLGAQRMDHGTLGLALRLGVAGRRIVAVIGQNQRRSGPRQALGNAKADALGAAGDQDGHSRSMLA